MKKRALSLLLCVVMLLSLLPAAVLAAPASDVTRKNVDKVDGILSSAAGKAELTAAKQPMGGTPSTSAAYGWYFETQAEFDAWTKVDADEDGYDWLWTQDPSNSFDYTPLEAYEGDGCVASHSYNNAIGVLKPDNWIISPEIDLTGTEKASLSYWVAAQDNVWPEEHYGVYAVTADSNDLLFEETLQSATYKNVQLDLSDYAGEKIQVAFRHYDSTDEYMMKIDMVEIYADVELGGPAPVMQKITKVAVTGMPTTLTVGESTAISASDVTITTDPADAATINEIYWNTIDETFQADKSYRLIVRFAPKTGYYFEFEDETGVEYYIGDVTFNGQPAFSAYETGSVPGELFATSQSMTPTEAPAEPVKITKVAITGVPTTLTVGESTAISASDVTITTDPADAADVLEIYWYNQTDDYALDSTFEAGKDYVLGITFQPKDGYYFEFDNSAMEYYTGEATFNGKAADIAWSRYSNVTHANTDFYTRCKPITPIVSYPVWVSGTQVTSAIKDNILGDTGTPTATYDPDTETLTLNGYDGGYIKADMALDIVLADGTTNKITVPEIAEKDGIKTEGDCTLSGKGDLSIENSANDHYGIYASNGDVIISCDGDVTVTTFHDSIVSYKGDVTISGSGDVTITSKAKATPHNWQELSGRCPNE